MLNKSSSKSHPRNYFQFTGIGTTRRKFGTFNEVNWERNYLDESAATLYCTKFITELTCLQGFLDTVFSTCNPLFRTHLQKQESRPNIVKRVPFRAVLGISSGADSSMTAELLCRALRIRYAQDIRFDTDQILLISFCGTPLNKVDSRKGKRFGRYLQKKYADLPINIVQVRIGTSDYARVLDSVRSSIPKQECTSNIRVFLDFHKASILNQVAEAYNFLHVDTTNLTEEALGETTDGTGGYGQISVPCIPKSLIYRILDLCEIPTTMGRNSVDTCTNQNKLRQYIAGAHFQKITARNFFDVIDRIILMNLSGYSSTRIIKETGHSPRFVHNALHRIHRALHREKLGGYAFIPEWRDGFVSAVASYKSSFHYFEELQRIFRITPTSQLAEQRTLQRHTFSSQTTTHV